MGSAGNIQTSDVGWLRSKQSRRRFVRSPYEAWSELQQKRRMTEEEVIRTLSALDLRERLMVKLAIFGGLRPGEILALRGRDVEECEVRIRQRVFRVIDTPKTEKSFRTVALPPNVVSDLRRG
jgi:integrase